MSKKIIVSFILVLLFFAGIIALTEELDFFSPGAEDEIAEYEEDTEYELYEPQRELPEWVLPARWFRSNAGGMAIEEIPSRLAALRNEYALVIDFTTTDELPEYLLQYFQNDFFIEIRKLFKNGEEIRNQWIFKDTNGTTRLIAVLRTLDDSNNDEETGYLIEDEIGTVEFYEVLEYYNDDYYHDYDTYDYDDNIETIVMEEYADDDIVELIHRFNMNGFIEIFNENSFITSEYRFYDDGSVTRIEYNYRDGIIISAAAFLWEEDSNGGKFKEMYTDFFRYNRSSFLRSIERIFYTDQQISALNEPVRVSFPANILDAARNDFFIGERFNTYPDFFGNLFVRANSRIVFNADDRGRILSQTLYDLEDNVIWAIVNTWVGDRIISIHKTEDDVELLAEYVYDSNEDLILERNIRNGVLERVVRTTGNRDIEELYIDNIIVLQAVWEDGRKISETRIRNN